MTFRLPPALSRWDITGGLVGYAYAGMDGHKPDTAHKILRNIVLFAAMRRGADGPAAGRPAGRRRPARATASAR